jgi:dUTP pyrophosphatase
MQKIAVRTRCLPNFKGDLPRYQSSFASGFDVRAQLEAPIVLHPGDRTMIPSGLAFEIPPGYELQARPRSGWASKQGITLLNSPGTIDADYRGEVKLIVANLGQAAVEIRDQDRIAQLVLCPVLHADLVVVDDLEASERGIDGFGSTGLTGNA